MPLSCMKLLSQELLDSLAYQAMHSPRLRYAYALHAPTERVQRLLIALQPGTYIRPHRHRQVPGMLRFEFLLVVQGQVGILLFDAHGRMVQTECIGSAQALHGVELAEATYHAAVALTPNTIVLEVKEGPYDASCDKEFLDLFPAENAPQAPQLVEQWQSHFGVPGAGAVILSMA